MTESGAGAAPIGQNPARPGWRVRAAIIGGFLLLFMACAASVFLSARATEAERWVQHTLEVRQNLARLNAMLADVETAQRGYLLLNDAAFTDLLADTRDALPALLRQLDTLVSDNPAQRGTVAEVRALIDKRLAVVDRSVAAQRAGRNAEAIGIVRAGEGLELAAQICDALARMDSEEASLFEGRQADAQAERWRLIGVIVISVIVGVGLMMAVLVVGRRFATAQVAINQALKAEIEQREKTEAQLRQAQKMEALGRLTGGVAHDFNNMLAIVVGNLDMALRRMNEAAPYRKMIENALEGGKRGAALTQRLLAFSRLQPLDPKPLDVNRSVADMTQLLARSLGEGMQIETVQAAGLWRAYVDGAQLENAILNLAINARDAMPDGGKLTLETANTYLDNDYGKKEDVAPGQYVLLAISDTGTGMAPDVIASAFEPFFTTKPTGVGTGLGLSQVHGFIKQTGGHVKIYSERGLGTTVKLYLPRARAEADAEPPRATAPADLALGKGHCVLVVEDEAGVRAFVSEALHDLGYTVIEAASAVAALDILTAHPEITLLVTDVVMPEMNGRQLVDKVKLVRPDLPVLYMTGYTRNAIVHNGVLDADTNLLTKPFTVSQLDASLRSMLSA